MIQTWNKSLITFVFVSICTLNIWAQSSKIDSLKSEAAIIKEDTARVSTLILLSKELLSYGEASEALNFASEANELSMRIDYDKGKAHALKYMGIAQFQQGEFLDVFESLTLSLESFEKIQDSTGIASILNNLGTVYYSQGSNIKALEYYLQSLRISERLNNPLRIATALVNIAGVYADNINDYDKTMGYYNRAIPYLKELNNVGISKSVLLGTGMQYFKKEKYDKALEKFEEALPVTENTFYYAENLTLLGQTHMKLGNIERAISYLDQAHDFASENNQQLEIVKVLIEKGDIYQDRDPERAIGFYSQAESIAQEMELNYELADIYLGMSGAHVNQGNFEKGYLFQTKFSAQKDSLFNLETDDKIRGLQFDFDLEKKQDEIGLLEKEAEIIKLREKRQKNAFYVALLISFLIVILALTLFNRYKYVKKSNRLIEEEKNRSEDLLLNILPKETANELKEKGKVDARKFESVSVLFADFESFTKHSHNLSPEALVKIVDYYFSKFDEIIEKFGLEKIKTIGDAYMCAGGIPFETSDHPSKIIRAAMEMTKFMDETKLLNDINLTCFDVRVGINTGSVVAGVVGTKKFAYDIWGDTVNVAARMESNSIRGKVNISQNTYDLVKNEFNCDYRGELSVKNKGMMKMYFVDSEKEGSKLKN